MIPAISHRIPAIKLVNIPIIPAMMSKIPATLGFLLIKIVPIIARINNAIKNIIKPVPILDNIP